MSLYGLIDKMRSERCPDAQLDPPAYQEPHCPICGEVCDFVFTDSEGICFGCENCVTRQSSEDFAACYADE